MAKPAYPYADPGSSPYADPRISPGFGNHAPYSEESGGHRGIVYTLMVIVVVAFGGAIWNYYSGHQEPPPRISAPAGDYRVAPSAANLPEPAESNAMYDSLEGHDTPVAAATPRPAPETPMAAAPAAASVGRPVVAPAPAFVASGPFVAQVAALQSEAAVDAAWQRLASRAPQLFAPARLDVERADLGQRGTYFRVRAGYFADRANASRFCDRIKQMGQDCIVVAR